ncbi:MAG: DNA/RNA non-specific endonuclease [Alphaproteobacteria bacterium]|nr:DNA/RNA non-specific endonuclease [Alphaproteobacteria bacterium]MBV9371430.1 DNA/RNA non-specific endonuclease [Alphaproteobacteria bacterium]MBV9902367.1 DNA/RNA non-specific endonuclease [Alphaproteobacteria bacterium]
MSDERLERVESALKNQDLKDAARRALQDGTLPPALMADLSRSALDDFHRDMAPLESIGPVGALEAIVRLTGRPPMLVRNDKVELQPLPDLPAGTDVKIRAVEKWIPSVGRVEFLNASMKWGGTGWVIRKDGKASIVCTNRHVAKLVAKRAADGRGVFMRSATTGVQMGAQVDFSEELGTTAGNSRTARITSIDYIADDSAADVALLRVDAPAIKMPSPLQLADKEAKEGDLVALIGYPAFDSRNDASAQARYFNDVYEVKRFAPGLIMQALSGSTTLTHDCTSLGGNSGSPLISLDTGKVVGLHFSGVFGEANTAVGVTTLQKLLKGGGTTVATKLATESVAAAESVADGSHSAEELKGRAGYDPDHLGAGVKAPWPKLPAAVAKDIAKPSDAIKGREQELRYTHFGVKYSATRRIPMMTAVNIDGEHSVRIKRANDKWFSDGRIPREIQLGQAQYKDLQIDRGHMVRREDPNWDSSGTGDAARQADADTFHYVNAAPQHSLLNQGKQLWQGLENYILDSARTKGFKACVFTGPIPRDDDPDIDGVQVPMEFWKLVAMLGADGKSLHATAYLLSQGQLIRDLMERRSRTEAVEGFVLGEFRTFQIAVKDLAEATGYDFGPYLKADPLAQTGAGQEAIESGEPVVLPLEAPGELVL